MSRRRVLYSGALAFCMLLFSYLYMYMVWKASDSFHNILGLPGGTIIRSAGHFYSVNDSLTACNSADIPDGIAEILDEHSIDCGLDEVKRMALELSMGIGRRDRAHIALTSKVLDLHTALRRTYPLNQKKLQITAQTKRASPKSLAFLKAYKVAGTHISSLLVTYAYTYDLNIDPSGRWFDEEKDGKKYSSCVDIAGTHHPPANFYDSVVDFSPQDYFCTPPLTFMFVRDPVERVWSAYNHFRTQYSTSINSFLRKNHNTLTPPHYFLSVDITQSLLLAANITILSADDMEVSLVMLAMRAGMGLCDILTAPCKDSANSWGASKCNDRKIEITDKAAGLISAHIAGTMEQDFHQQVMMRFQTEASAPAVQRNLQQYLAVRKEAMKVCSSDLSYKAFENAFYLDPSLRLVSMGKQWVLAGEDYYEVIPSWVCMQAYCRQVGKEFT